MCKIFDVTPLFGTLHPGKSEKVMLTFFGHAFIECQVPYPITLTLLAFLSTYREL